MKLGRLNQILPGTGRGTVRSMVVGAGGLTRRGVVGRAPSTTLRAVPLPMPGRIDVASVQPKHYNDLIM